MLVGPALLLVGDECSSDSEIGCMAEDDDGLLALFQIERKRRNGLRFPSNTITSPQTPETTIDDGPGTARDAT